MSLENATLVHLQDTQSIPMFGTIFSAPALLFFVCLVSSTFSGMGPQPLLAFHKLHRRINKHKTSRLMREYM